MKKLAILQSRVDSIHKGSSANGIAYAKIDTVMKLVDKHMSELGLYSVENLEPIQGVPLIQEATQKTRNGERKM